MSEETWIIAIDGQQIEGEHGAEQVRTLMRTNPGRQIVVWNDTMTAWADPATLSAFRADPAPAAVTATAPSPRPQVTSAAPAPRPTARPGASAASAAAAEFAARGPELRNAIQNDAKFFKGLLDFGFTEFITPKIVRTLYILSAALIALGFLGLVGTAISSILMGIRLSSGFSIIGGIVFLALTPVIAIIQITLARVFFELVLLVFRMKDALVHLEEKSK
jgi:Domain of unknown function (DUF4282)